jgi:hypothetical protein
MTLNQKRLDRALGALLKRLEKTDCVIAPLLVMAEYQDRPINLELHYGAVKDDGDDMPADCEADTNNSDKQEENYAH